MIARTVGERLSKALGQPVVIENKSGEAGAISAGEVSRARADGYTLLMTITDSQINNTALHKSLVYDPQKDFVVITQSFGAPRSSRPVPAQASTACRTSSRKSHMDLQSSATVLGALAAWGTSQARH